MVKETPTPVAAVAVVTIEREVSVVIPSGPSSTTRGELISFLPGFFRFV